MGLQPLFSEEFVEVAPENPSQRNQHVHRRVVQAVLHLAEYASGDVHILALELGDDFRGFHVPLFPEPADICADDGVQMLVNPFSHKTTS